MSIVFGTALVLLAMAAFLITIRLARGPTIADRVVAVDSLLLVLLISLGVLAAATGESRYIVLMIVLSLIGFVATTASARFLETWKGDDDDRS